uniref:RBR-type E3 ubiquitin transferase n=1 Tax=Tetradesmus obliquus TaxID=3088 RepID=A0A383VK43_TETOB|eukprot:jgi/Sobl393_1/15650/SZX65908.1
MNSFKRRIPVAPDSTSSVTTRTRAARAAAVAAPTAANVDAAAPPAADAGAGLTNHTAAPQQRLAGATTRSRAAAGGSSSISAAAARSVGGGSRRSSSQDAAAAAAAAGAAGDKGSRGGSSSKQAVKTLSCGICLDDVSSSSMYRLGCRHSFCRACLAAYLKARLQDNQLPAACPSAGCRRPVSQAEAAALLAGTPRLRNKFLQATKEASAIARGTAIYCPRSSCSELVKVTRLTPAAARGLSAAQAAAKQQQLARVQCSHCSHECCTSCRCAWHAGLSCASYQALPASEKGEADLALFQLGSSQHWRRCPTCRAMVERIEGCNYMMCRCGEPFCYACGAPINTCYNSGCAAAAAAVDD